MNYYKAPQLTEAEIQTLYQTVHCSHPTVRASMEHCLVDLEEKNLLPLIGQVRLKHDPAEDIETIRFFYMCSNQTPLPSIPSNCFAPLSNLLTLSLHKNRTTFLHDAAFSGLPQLRYLCLSGNALRDIKPAAFVGLLSLKTLDLRNNLISFLSPDLFQHMPKLKKLLVGGNTLSEADLQQIAANRNVTIDVLEEQPQNVSTCTIM
jgi:hypothetical protein